MVGKCYQIPTFFVNDFSKREWISKMSVSTMLYRRGASSHFFIRDWEASHSKNHFCGKMKLFTHIVDCETSQYCSIGMCKSTPFHQYVVGVQCSYQCKLVDF